MILVPHAARRACLTVVMLVACTVTGVPAASEPRVAADEPVGKTTAPAAPASSESPPMTEKERAELQQKIQVVITKLNAAIAANPDNLQAYSQRGDMHFFKGDFAAAVRDYDKMIALDPQLENSHWRRGIACFYAGQYADAAHQFEIYHSFDDVDRENGIWRFLSQAKSVGLKKAREGLLKYKKDDREPFPAVYKLFAGELTGEQVLKQIRSADLAEDEREKRLFYAELYVGLNEFVEGRLETAEQHLRRATANAWGPEAGYGPNYMWHVGRVHYDLLVETRLKKTRPAPPRP